MRVYLQIYSTPCAHLWQISEAFTTYNGMLKVIALLMKKFHILRKLYLFVGYICLKNSCYTSFVGFTFIKVGMIKLGDVAYED